MTEQFLRNYHSDLIELQASLDPLIIRLRKKESDHWVWKAIMGPLKQFLSMFRYARFAAMGKTLLLSAIPAAAGVVAFFASAPVWVSICCGILVLLLTYGVFVVLFIGKMVQYGSPEFHAGAFKARRPLDYAQLKPVIDKESFTFAGLSSMVNAVFSQAGHKQEDIQALIAHFEGLKQQYEERLLERDRDIEDLERTYEEQIEEYRGIALEFSEDAERSDTAIRTLINLIESVNICLYRMKNGILKLEDLDFISGITLYEKVGSSLTKIADKGTTGASPATISLENPGRYEQWGVVQAAISEPGGTFKNVPYSGRIVVSHRMKMSNERDWIINFHFQNTDEKSLSLLLANDIIESREVYRIFHALCLLLQESGEVKEVAPDDATGTDAGKS